MSLIKTAFACVTAAIIFVLAEGQTLVEPSCLGCICKARSGCDVSWSCRVPSPGSYCGPFGIGKSYWSEAWFDSPNHDGDFEICVNDIYCAAETVRRYMEKYAANADCNGDGVVNCYDFAQMHVQGRHECLSVYSRPFDNSFLRAFETCWKDAQNSNATLVTNKS